MAQLEESGIRHYYVDEAGDPSLFKRRGKVIVGEQGCSSFFILGLADVREPTIVAEGLESLRRDMLADPYFANVPSFHSDRRKTALAFHAKDDLPEVRREVFRFLMRQDIRFFAVVRCKRTILKVVQTHQSISPNYKYHPNQLYDRCVSRLFRDRLHKSDGYKVCFAERGSSDRTVALEKALSQARRNFMNKHGIESSAPIQITAESPRWTTNLQVVDYYLWALQRAYEKGEDRFIQSINEHVGVIHDVDDKRNAGYGEYYTRSEPLTIDKISRIDS